MKDERNEDWPVLGVCQGHEVIGIIMADDDHDVLDKIVLYGVNRKTKHLEKESRLFETFPEDIIDKMEN